MEPGFWYAVDSFGTEKYVRCWNKTEADLNAIEYLEYIYFFSLL